MAAAPGYKLPLFPEPLHVFYSTSLKVTVNETLYVNNQVNNSKKSLRNLNCSLMLNVNTLAGLVIRPRPNNEYLLPYSLSGQTAALGIYHLFLGPYREI